MLGNAQSKYKSRLRNTKERARTTKEECKEESGVEKAVFLQTSSLHRVVYVWDLN
jgi:hypothetical protein